jgi:hypothetical protein
MLAEHEARRAHLPTIADISHAVLADVTAVPDAVGPPTLDALAERITAKPFTLLHFVCHGALTKAGETVLYLADAHNQVAPVPTSQLAANAEAELAKPVPDPSLALLLAKEAVAATRFSDGYVTINAYRSLTDAIHQVPPWQMTLRHPYAEAV